MKALSPAVQDHSRSPSAPPYRAPEPHLRAPEEQNQPNRTKADVGPLLRERPAVLSIPTRLLLGFTAGALSHVVFQGALGTAYFAFGLIPGLPWGFEPLPPFGVPRTVNF